MHQIDIVKNDGGTIRVQSEGFAVLYLDKDGKTIKIIGDVNAEVFGPMIAKMAMGQMAKRFGL